MIPPIIRDLISSLMRKIEYSEAEKFYSEDEIPGKKYTVDNTNFTPLTDASEGEFVIKFRASSKKEFQNMFFTESGRDFFKELKKFYDSRIDSTPLDDSSILITLNLKQTFSLQDFVGG